MRAALAAVLVCVFAAQAPAYAAAAPESIPTGQLPRSAEPLHYDLRFNLDPQRDGFDGETRIRIRLHEASDHLWLHGRDLRISAVSWSDASGAQGEARYQQRNADGVARVDFGRTLAAQDIELSFIYSGFYSRSLEGIYKVTRGEDSYLVTQMEDIAARRAFPGFDEPSFKTPFDITLTVPEKSVAIANTRQISDERGAPGLKTLRFASTEPLPTYLVAFAVGPWEVSDTTQIPANEFRSSPINLRVIGPRGSRDKLDYAQKTTPAIVSELERYFGIAYPFDKLDLLAAPDFAFGAMENAGLITFREVLLLLDKNAPASSLQSYYEVNAHELAHQWFGDYVTLRWWDDIWLNEAFATWMEAKVTERLRPEYRAGLGNLEGTLGAMRNDSLISARRIREPIRDTGDIGAAFDSITYQKGGGVLAMFESWLGEEQFRDGVRLFMRKHARGNATAGDLISALAEASGKGETLARAMHSFLDQPGIPFVNTQLRCEKNKARLTLRQSRYLPLGSQGRQASQWQVPVCLKLGRGGNIQRQCVLLEQPMQTFELDGCPDWYMPNAGGAGYYRYSMPAADLAKLNTHVAELSPAEQMIYADAVSAGFHSGKLGPQAVLQAMPQLAGSPLPNVATALLKDFNWIREHLADARSDEALRRYAIALYQPRLDQLGYTARPGESQDDILLRRALADFLALDLNSAAARQALLAAAQDLWQASSAGRLALDRTDPDTLASVLGVLVQEGGEAVARRYMAELQQNQNPQQRSALLSALGAVIDPKMAAVVRDFALDGKLQLREMLALFAAHQARPENRAAFWAWMQPNFERFIAPFPGFAQSRIPNIAAGSMCSAQEASDLRKFFRPRLAQISGGKRAFAQAHEGVRLCSALRVRQDGGLAHWAAGQPAAGEISLAEKIASPQRSPEYRARDIYRHPQQTLEFLGLQPAMTVVEIWPAPGWYTEILAPYLREHGKYIAAGFVTSWKDAPDWRKDAMKQFRAKLAANPALYDGVKVTELGKPDRWQAAPAGSADLVLTFRNIHNWIAGAYQSEMFASFYNALKPGGVLGVVEHRAAPGTSLEQMQQSGYVTEEYVIKLAEEAGFKLAAKAEINANPQDSKDYAKGVWTLPPSLQLGEADREKYLAIGESDRMTLKFVKP